MNANALKNISPELWQLGGVIATLVVAGILAFAIGAINNRTGRRRGLVQVLLGILVVILIVSSLWRGIPLFGPMLFPSEVETSVPATETPTRQDSTDEERNSTAEQNRDTGSPGVSARTNSGDTVACKAQPGKDGIKFDGKGRISAGPSDASAIQLEFWANALGDGEYTAVVEPGTYQVRSSIKSGDYGGTFWYWPTSCSLQEVEQQTGLSIDRRNEAGFDNAGRSPDEFDEMFEKVS